MSLVKEAIKLLVIATILFFGYGYHLNDSYQNSTNAFELIERQVQKLVD